MLRSVENRGMRISVELEEKMIKDIMLLTGERKMSAAIAKAAEMFTKRLKAVALIRSLREDPLDYGQTNEELEEASDPEPASMARKSVDYRNDKRKLRKS